LSDHKVIPVAAIVHKALTIDLRQADRHVQGIRFSNHSKGYLMRDQKHSTWIVVADGGNARILLNTHRDKGLSEIPLVSKHDPRLASHSSDNAADVHHTTVFKPTEERRNEDKFVYTLAETIQAGVAKHECDGLILISPANVLGLLRKALSAATRKKVLAEIVHDYTHQDNKFIYDQVRAHLPL
jgi:protein required for attachment to host cells